MTALRGGFDQTSNFHCIYQSIPPPAWRSIPVRTLFSLRRPQISPPPYQRADFSLTHVEPHDVRNGVPPSLRQVNSERRTANSD